MTIDCARVSGCILTQRLLFRSSPRLTRLRHRQSSPNSIPSLKRPGNKLAAELYIKKLAEAVSTGEINPNDYDFSRISLHGADCSSGKGFELQKIGSKCLSQINFGGCNLADQKFSIPMRGFYAPGANIGGCVFDGCEMPEATSRTPNATRPRLSAAPLLQEVNCLGWRARFIFIELISADPPSPNPN